MKLVSLNPNPNHSNSSASSSSWYLQCISLSSFPSASAIHGRLLKTSLQSNTFLSNRLLHFYSQFGALLSVLRLFNDLSFKNIFTWNILLSALSNSGRTLDARKVFDRMSNRDAVSWNSIISSYVLHGIFDAALEAVRAMREVGLRGNAHTVSISAFCAFSKLHAKQIHGSAVRCGFDSSCVVVGNSLIKMYDRAGLVSYAYSVFQRLENPDTISWNSMISAWGNSGQGSASVQCFRSMLASGFKPDEFSISAMISICADLGDLAKN